jgi:hypothetical protein
LFRGSNCCADANDAGRRRVRFPASFPFGSDIELEAEITGGTRCPITVRLDRKHGSDNRISSPLSNGTVRTSGLPGALTSKAGFTGRVPLPSWSAAAWRAIRLFDCARAGDGPVR